MNSQLEEFARNTLKSGLQQCTEAQQLLFKRMYANGNLKSSIDTVVDLMPTDKLDWAMQQVQATGETEVHVGTSFWCVRESVKEIRELEAAVEAEDSQYPNCPNCGYRKEALEADAKAPPAEEPELDWRAFFTLPLVLAVQEGEQVCIRSSDGAEITGCSAALGSPRAKLYAHIVKLVNEREAD